MNIAYCLQSSLILYFFKAAGKTFQQGSSSVTLKLLAAAPAASRAACADEVVEDAVCVDAFDAEGRCLDSPAVDAVG